MMYKIAAMVVLMLCSPTRLSSMDILYSAGDTWIERVPARNIRLLSIVADSTKPSYLYCLFENVVSAWFTLKRS